MPGEREAVDNAVRSSTDQREFLVSATAIGLMVISKWDRADLKHQNASPKQTVEFDSFTEAEVRQFNQRASTMLGEQVAVVAHKQKPSFWFGVGQGVVAAFLYSLFLIIVYVFGSKIGGHDLIDIARQALGKGRDG